MRSAQPALDGLVDADLPDGCPREFRKVCRCPRVRPTPPAPLLTRRSGLRVLDQEASIARNLSADTRRPGAKPSRPSAAATGAPGVQPIEERGLRSVCGGRLGWGDRCGEGICAATVRRFRRRTVAAQIPAWTRQPGGDECVARHVSRNRWRKPRHLQRIEVQDFRSKICRKVFSRFHLIEM